VYRLWSSSLCSLLQPPATSSHLDPNNVLSTVLRHCHLCSSFSVREQVSNAYKTNKMTNWF
jgi:hypothetical protein